MKVDTSISPLDSDTTSGATLKPDEATTDLENLEAALALESVPLSTPKSARLAAALSQSLNSPSLARRQTLLVASYLAWLIALIVGERIACAWTAVLIIALIQATTKLLARNENRDNKVPPQELELAELIDWAVILFSVLVLSTAAVCKINFKMPQPVNRQAIEISLLSPSDAINRQDILPASEAVEDTVKHHGDIENITETTVQPKTTVQQETTKAPVELRQSQAQPKVQPKIQPPMAAATAPTGTTSDTAGEQFKYNAPAGWKTIVVPGAKIEPAKTAEKSPSKTAKPAVNQPAEVLSEVTPGSFIESIDNEGENDHVVQSGGRSDNGTGAAAELHQYLKDLNRRIKRQWLPPAGMEEVVLIQFRVSAQGKLLAVTPVNSDGAPADAAMAAVRKAFPFKALPSSFTSPYLDIRYTFNYRINELNDIPIQLDRLPAN